MAFTFRRKRVWDKYRNLNAPPLQWAWMGTLSSFTFSSIPPIRYRNTFRNTNSTTKCFLCGDLLPKRRRRLVSQRSFVIKSCYDNRNSSSDDEDSNGERDTKESSTLATMENNKSDDTSDTLPSSMSSRVRVSPAQYCLIWFDIRVLENTMLLLISKGSYWVGIWNWNWKRKQLGPSNAFTSWLFALCVHDSFFIASDEKTFFSLAFVHSWCIGRQFWH